MTIPIVLLWALVACGTPTTGSVESGDTADEWAPTEPTVPDTDPTVGGLGTQVGSEGFWGCEIELAEPISDIAAQNSDLGNSPEALVTQRIGDWPLQVVDSVTNELATGSMSIGNVGSYLWLDVAEGPGCADQVAVSVTAMITMDSPEPLEISGYIAIRPGEGKLMLTHDGSSPWLETQWRPPSFAVNPTSTLQLRIEAALAESAVAGKLTWEDCEQGACTNSDVLATVVSSR